MLSDLFSCCNSIPTIPVPYFQLLPCVFCTESIYVPLSPAKRNLINYGPSQLFLGSSFSYHHLGQVLHIYKYIFAKVKTPPCFTSTAMQVANTMFLIPLLYTSTHTFTVLYVLLILTLLQPFTWTNSDSLLSFYAY
jgi:hypothetical protein